MQNHTPSPSSVTADPIITPNKIPPVDPALVDDQVCSFGSDPTHDKIKRSSTPTSELPELLSAAEVQAIFGRSSRTIRRWIGQGYLTPVRVGRSLFFHPDDIRCVISNELQDRILAGDRRKT